MNSSISNLSVCFTPHMPIEVCFFEGKVRGNGPVWLLSVPCLYSVFNKATNKDMAMLFSISNKMLTFPQLLFWDVSF